MNETKLPLNNERNPETHQQHKKEVLWQITVPLILGVLVILLLASLSVSSAVNQSRLADISLIWIILPNLMMALIIIFMLAGMVYGLMKLTGILPFYAQKVQMFFNIVKTQTQKIDERLVEPVIKGKTSTASLRKLLQQLFGRNNHE